MYIYIFIDFSHEYKYWFWAGAINYKFIPDLTNFRSLFHFLNCLTKCKYRYQIIFFMRRKHEVLN